MAVNGSKKLLAIPISDTYAYAVKARKRIGYDKNACEEGDLVYAIDSTRGIYEDPIVLKGPPRCGNVRPALFKNGSVHEDQYVKVEVLAQDGRTIASE